MTAEEYNRLAPLYDHKKAMIERDMALICPRINRTGKLYKKKLQEIRMKYGVRN